MLEPEHLCVFFGGELHAHAAEFLDAHAVLARHRAAHRHAGFQNVGAKQFGPVQLLRVIRIEQDQRMQVAIARMKNVAAAQAVLALHFLNR